MIIHFYCSLTISFRSTQRDTISLCFGMLPLLLKYCRCQRSSSYFTFSLKYYGRRKNVIIKRKLKFFLSSSICFFLSFILSAQRNIKRWMIRSAVEWKWCERDFIQVGNQILVMNSSTPLLLFFHLREALFTANLCIIISAPTLLADVSFRDSFMLSTTEALGSQLNKTNDKTMIVGEKNVPIMQMEWKH